MQSYPANLPNDALSSLVSIVKSGSLMSNRAAFGMAVWNVQGFIQSKALGTPVLQSSPDALVIRTHLEALAFCETINTDEKFLQSLDWTSLKPLLIWCLQELIVLLA